MEELSTTSNTKTIKISEDVFNPNTAKSRKTKTIKKTRKPVLDTAQLQAKLINNINKRNTLVNNRKQVGGVSDTSKPQSVVSFSESTSQPVAKSIDTPLVHPKDPPPPPIKEPAKSEYEESLHFMSAIKEPPRKYRKPKLPQVDKQDNIIHIHAPSSEHVDISQNRIVAPLKYNIDNEIPHGCLKNGLKKTLKNINKSVGVAPKHVTFDPSIVASSDAGRLTIEPMTPHQPSTLGNTSTLLDASNKETSDYLGAMVIPDEDETSVLLEPAKTVPEDTKKIQMDKDETIPEPPIINPIVQPEISNEVPLYTEGANSQNTSNVKVGGGTRRYKIKKTFRLGRHPTKKIVSIFCKNIEMINGIKKIQSTLKTKSINDMKRYLVRKSLMSVGSTAPNDIIKHMYVSAITSGNICNKNPDMMLDNFIKTS
jgi:hypothetical protein